MLLEHSITANGQVITEQVAQPEPTVAQLSGASERRRPAPGRLAAAAGRAPLRARTDRAASPRTRSRRTSGRRAISDFFADPKNDFTYSLQSADRRLRRRADRLPAPERARRVLPAVRRVHGSHAAAGRRAVAGRARLRARRPERRAASSRSRTFDAHAWVEAYFAGIGWVPFDPTPLAGISGGAANDLPWAPHPKPEQRRSTPDDASTAARSAPAVTPTTTSHAASRRAGRPTTARRSTAPLIALIVLVVVVLHRAAPGVRAMATTAPATAPGRAHGDTDALWAELGRHDDRPRLRLVAGAHAAPGRAVAGRIRRRRRRARSTCSRRPSNARATADPIRTAGPTARPICRASSSGVRAGLGLRRSPRERMRARFWPASLDWSRARGHRSLAARDANGAPPLIGDAPAPAGAADSLERYGFSSKRRRIRSSMRARKLLGRATACRAARTQRRPLGSTFERCRSDCDA